MPTSQRDEQFPFRRAEYALIAAFWLAYAVLSIASRLLDRGSAGLRGLSGAAVVALIEAICWAALTIPIFILAARLDSYRKRSAQVLVVIGAGLVIAYAAGAFGMQLRRTLTPFGPGGPRVADSSAPPPRISESPQAAGIPQTQRAGTDSGIGPRGPRPLRQPGGPPIWFGVSGALVLYFGVFSAGLARVFSRRYQLRREEAARNEARLEAQLAEARLDALRRQLDPHFLFNTLNAVSALLERDPRGVRRMISRLSELLRHSFEGTSEAEVPLRDELSLLNRYVEIMQVRFQGRLTIETKVSDEALDGLVPNMVLQPIVENAIKHGIEKITEPGHIHILADVVDNVLVLSVQDNGAGLSDQRREGVGVTNTLARLGELYRNAGTFTLHAAGDGGTIAEIRVPFHVRTGVTHAA